MTFAKTANLRTNPNNPRAIRKDQLNKLVKSLQEFPEMLEARPIVIDKDGHRARGQYAPQGGPACRARRGAGFVREWDEEKDAEFIIKDNVSFGEWDWDMLGNNEEPEQLQEWGLTIPWDNTEEEDEQEDTPNTPKPCKHCEKMLP